MTIKKQGSDSLEQISRNKNVNHSAGEDSEEVRTMVEKTLLACFTL